MAKKLVLFSQPSKEIFKKLKVELFPKFLTGRRFAYMPSDGSDQENNQKYLPVWKNFVEANQAEFIFVDNSQRGGLVNLEKQKILSADVLMITGGNTFKLLHQLRQSGLDETILDFWRKDNVVLSGFSAGAIVLSPSIETSRDINELQLVNLNGLNIVNFEIWPHYNSSQEQVLSDFKSKNNPNIRTITNDEIILINQ
ncbi:Type 1 glutamine amidotransferase-like domain-containing protein [Patescibacteria group bacterium]|nr:Type 1 glutamine amidotransferase-like domain-containing protein [Patescibacteria group bacterium]